jgi:hypothetical protein
MGTAGGGWDATQVQALAAIVQAIAAGVTVVLTAVLVWATRRYVGLTAELAKAATAEGERQRKVAADQRLRFLAIVGRLDVLVADLPEDRAESKIRAALVWEVTDVDQLLALAPHMGLATVVDAESAGPSLRWLRERVRFVQRVPEKMGLDWDKELPAEIWTERLTYARKALRDISRRETPADLKPPDES